MFPLVSAREECLPADQKTLVDNEASMKIETGELRWEKIRRAVTD